MLTCTQREFQYLQNITDWLFHTTFNCPQLQRTPQHILKIPTLMEKSTPHVENSITAENSTTCIDSSAIAIALQTSTIIHRAIILKGMEGVQFWYIPLQYKPSFTWSSNWTLILPKYKQCYMLWNVQSAEKFHAQTFFEVQMFGHQSRYATEIDVCT